MRRPVARRASRLGHVREIQSVSLVPKPKASRALIEINLNNFSVLRLYRLTDQNYTPTDMMTAATAQRQREHRPDWTANRVSETRASRDSIRFTDPSNESYA